MMRTFSIGFLFLTLASCQVPQERAPRTLPDDAPPMTYADLLSRSRAQARVATEAFYVDRWCDLEDAAKGLEQTARFLLKAEDVPPTLKGNLPGIAADLGKEAKALNEAAKARNEKETTASLQRINLKVRELRLAP
jgi:hypothetical protein